MVSVLHIHTEMKLEHFLRLPPIALPHLELAALLHNIHLKECLEISLSN